MSSSFLPLRQVDVPVADALRLLLRLQLLEQVNESNLADFADTSVKGSSVPHSTRHVNSGHDDGEEDGVGYAKDARRESQRRNEAAGTDNARSRTPCDAEEAQSAASEGSSQTLPSKAGGTPLGASDWLRAAFGDPPQLWSLEEESVKLLFGFSYPEATQEEARGTVQADEDDLCGADGFRTVSIQKAEEVLHRILVQALRHKRA